MKLAPLIVLIAVLQAVGASAGDIPSRFGIDAPELARPGGYPVGYKILRLVEHDQLDVLRFDPGRGEAPRGDRKLTVDLWYPARAAAAAPRVIYTASLPSALARPVSFSVPGMAVFGAAAVGTNHPLVVVSHGYSNDPAAMTWLTENLASKGYIVAAIRHDDPSITDGARRAGPYFRRPLDIVFVTRELQKELAAQHLIDPSRTALVGYSIGGYGVLTAAGAVLEPTGPLTERIPGHLEMPYVRGGARQGDVALADLRAVVAISPAGGGAMAAWGAGGLKGITAPLLLIAGDHDLTVDYASGARAFFDAAVNSRRYLLTFEGGGHSIGLSPVPDAMRSQLWDQDWFEDPVWRKERVNAINAHFITAFLDRFVKGDETRAAYLDVTDVEASAGVFPATVEPAAYDAYSPGTGNITLWKGFQRNHATGLQLRRARPDAMVSSN